MLTAAATILAEADDGADPTQSTYHHRMMMMMPVDSRYN